MVQRGLLIGKLANLAKNDSRVVTYFAENVPSPSDTNNNQTTPKANSNKSIVCIED